MRLNMPATSNMSITPATQLLRYDQYEASDAPRVTGGLNQRVIKKILALFLQPSATPVLRDCATPIQPRRLRDPPQHLLEARRNASRGHLLPRKVANGHYGNAFWGRVAERVPGRTAAECLDGFLASDLKDTAYFHGAGAARAATPSGAALSTRARR